MDSGYIVDDPMETNKVWRVFSKYEDKCGTSGWEVLHTELGEFKLIDGIMQFVYYLYVKER